MSWKVGTVTVAGTGTLSVPLGGRPKMLVLYGANFPEDTPVTSSGCALVRGMAAPSYADAGTLLQSGASVSIAGNAHHCANGTILNLLDTSGGLSFSQWAVASFTADGFSLNFSTATAGRKLVYLALMSGEARGFIGMCNSAFALPFKAGASLIHGAWAGPDIGGSDRTQEFYGGAAYPGMAGGSSWMSAGMTAFCFPTSSSAQYDNELSINPPHIRVASGGHFTGPFLVTSNILAYPSGTDLLTFNFAGDVEDGGMVVAWDDERSATGILTPAAAVDGELAVTGLPFAPKLLIGYTISDEPPGQGTGGRGAAGFFVVTPTFQWAATVDGVSDPGAYQSFSLGFIDRVSGTARHAGTVELTSDGFVMRTTEAGLSPSPVAWQAFGAPTLVAPITGIYRRIRSI